MGEQEESYWIETFNIKDQISLKDSNNVFVESGLS